MTRCGGWNANVIFDVGVFNLGIYPKNGRMTSSPIFLGKVSRMSSMVFCTLGKCSYSLSVARGNSCEMCDHIAFFLANALDSDRWDTHLAFEKQSRAIPVHNTHPTPLEPKESRG
ncbi:hypothetical protein TNIN_360971 [Trichonephila inaurata madagascariensis]|uniref:Uncharacterized protein n=1 Tax=Trichonephila inaurata madagascariensis TaxID=2747483 RepID=A0A8X7BTA3_9ARAC|nr:hypothetical protein TNIN_360971 [Trichonephila inaurata madagascariensis]